MITSTTTHLTRCKRVSPTYPLYSCRRTHLTTRAVAKVAPKTKQYIRIRNTLAHRSNKILLHEIEKQKEKEKDMGEEGQVISCHTDQTWEEQLTKANESKKLVILYHLHFFFLLFI